MRAPAVLAAAGFAAAIPAFGQPPQVPAPGGAAHALAAGALSAPAPPADPAPSDAENAPADDAIPVPPVPPRIAAGDQYDRCMDMLAEDPAGADALATAWRAGGEAATHGHALAPLELGNPAAGAALLTTLATTSTADAAARAEVFGQAAQAWTMAGDTTRALDTATQAISLAPEDPDLRVIHATAALAAQHPQAAEDDLAITLATDPNRTDALVLRATARRQLGQLAPALADIETALRADPQNADALLERGIIRERQGDLLGAKSDWQHVVDAAPDSASSELAEQNLALLDAGPRQ